MADMPMRTEGAEPIDLTSGPMVRTRHSIRDRQEYMPEDDIPTDIMPAIRRLDLLGIERAASLQTSAADVSKDSPRKPLWIRPYLARSGAGVAWARVWLARLSDAWEMMRSRLNIPPAVVNGFLVAVTACVIAVTLPGVWILVAAVAIGFCMIALGSTSSRALLTMLLAATVGVTSVDYLTWRFEVSNWVGWWIAVPLLAAEVFGALHALGLQYTLWPRPAPVMSGNEDPTRRPIYIFIPTVNEGVEVLKPTLLAVKAACQRFALAFPGAQTRIVVCNDGYVAGASNWRQTEALARRLHVQCVTRTQGGGAKAGNIEHARQVVGATGDALIVIFDADQQPKPEFLLQTIPPFGDPSLGWAQTGQYYRNLEQPIAAWANDQQALFYRVLCPGKAAQNAAFICGTNVVLRAAALDEIGGLPQDSVTEDFAASIQLHGRWRSVFLSDVLAMGLGPMDLPAYLRQQRRWAIGTLGVLRSHWRMIVLPWEGDLSFAQRIQYALACTHYLSGVRDLIYVVAPLAFLITGIPAVVGANLGMFVWHFVPYWIASQAAFWYASRRESGLRGIVIGFGSFPALLMSVAAVVSGKRSGFMVTSKQRNASRSWRELVPYVALFLLCLAGLALGMRSTGQRRDAVAISMMWIAYSASLLGGFIWLGVRDLRYQEAAHRERSVSLAAWIQAIVHAPPLARARSWGESVTARYSAPRLGYLLLSGGLLVAALVTSVRDFSTLSATAFTPTLQRQSHPYLGVSLRTESLSSAPGPLDQTMCEPFTIIGRTEYIDDQFPTAWADSLAAHKAQPWVVLEFGQFGADGKPPLDAGLLAIANGLQDANLRRWADEIRTYGKPVYLTILLHVDRNWAVTSAVANGGIPQDSARAWLHAQAIFRMEGVKNVAWVWAPADPAHDQAYAPPEQSISVVLQSFLRYPGTPWPNVSKVLAQDTARHPGKPLFVEVSAEGSPAHKSAWLNSVTKTVASDHHVYALIYHEGSPDVHATAADNKLWSFESDSLSTQSVKAWRTLIHTSQPAC